MANDNSTPWSGTAKVIRITLQRLVDTAEAKKLGIPLEQYLETQNALRATRAMERLVIGTEGQQRKGKEEV